MTYGPPRLGLQNTITPQMPRMLPAMRVPMGPGVQPSGPTGLAALLAKPGLRDALLATGSALMAQADQGGSLGGALGNALPFGFQAFQHAKEKAAADELLASAPPEMRALLKALPPRERVSALLGLMKPAEQQIVPVGAAVVEGGKEVYRNTQSEKASGEPTTAEREFAFYSSLTPEQKKVFDEMKSAGKGPLVQVNTGEKDISKLPVGVQAGVTGSQGVRAALDRFEGYAKEWLAQPKAKRAMSQLGLPDEDRDTLLGNLASVRQELVLNLKNLAELGVLAGPDMDILNEMIGEPASKEALYRSPEFMLTKIERVREYVDNKVNAYERTYGITVPKGAEKPKAAVDPLGIR